MKKNILLSLGLFLSLSAHANKINVGIVNFQKAIQEVAKGKSAKDSLEKEVDGRRKQVEKLQAEIQKMNEDFQKKASALNEKARTEQGMKIQEKFAQMQEMQQRFQMELQQKEAELTRPIIDGLRALVPEVSRKRKLDLVFEASSGVLLYSTNQTDITEELIRLYDSKNK